MKVMEIGIKSLHEGMQEFKEAFLAAQKRNPFKLRQGAYFTSLDAARNFLTPKRLELLHVVKQKNPTSLYELAKLAGRSFPSVVRDVNVLSRHGLIRLTARAAAPRPGHPAGAGACPYGEPQARPSGRKKVHPEVLYDAINLWIGI